MEKICYLDTYNGCYCYDDYVDECKDFSKRPAPEDSQEFAEWIRWNIDHDIEDFFHNLRHVSPVNNYPCVVKGTLGLWDGLHKIEPREFERLDKAIEACISGSDYYRVTLAGGVLSVEATHHDGTNLFEITPVGGGKYVRLY